jgi:ATP synthase protein I
MPEVENKLNDLKSKIEQANIKYQPPKARAPGDNTVRGGKILIDLISGLAVGAFLGYTIDQYFGTTPLFLFLLSIAGMGGGFYNFYKDNMKGNDNA